MPTQPEERPMQPPRSPLIRDLPAAEAMMVREKSISTAYSAGAELQGDFGNGLGDDDQDDAGEEAAKAEAEQGPLNGLARLALFCQGVSVGHGGRGGYQYQRVPMRMADIEPPKVPAL